MISKQDLALIGYIAGQPGYNVNAPEVVPEWVAYRVYPKIPAVVFAGGITVCYTFASEGAFIDALNKANSSHLMAVGGSAAATSGVSVVVKKLQLRTASDAVLGPFVDVQAGNGCYLADGQELPFAVTGVAVVEDWVEPPPPPPTAQDRADFSKQIDADTDYIYSSVQGDRVTEYILAEQDATAYKAAGYTGTVPSSVASWASAKAKDAKWAADDILATATAWRGAQGAIRAQRLAIKEASKTAATLTTLKAQWAGFSAAIKKQLGVA